jgi:enterochelin esterase-like enzyme
LTAPAHEVLAHAAGGDGLDVDAFLADRSVPIVEGPEVTFLWRGEADAVRLRHFIYGLRASQSMHRIPGTDLWYVVVVVPYGSRFEYKIEIQRGEARELVTDPLNPHFARDPFGANSVCQGHGYSRPEWIERDSDSRRGALIEAKVPSQALGRAQPLTVYLPARHRMARRYPLLVVFDGPDYVRYARLRTVLDNLIHRHEVAPMVVALSHSTDRLREYAADPRHARYVMTELIPWLEARYPLRPGPDERGLMGASFGGVAALSAAWRHPGRVGRLLLQSGSFAFTDIGESERGPVFAPVVEFVNRFREAPGRPAERMFVSCGQYESLIHENRALVALLQDADLDLKYVEARDGHNWENWRDRLRVGLSWLFPGPLLEVYE